MISVWEGVKLYFNRYSVGEHVRRRDLIEALRDHGIIGNKTSTVDTYRNYLDKAGYLNTVGRGIYLVEKRIPHDLSVADVKSEAYGIFDFNGTARRIVSWRREVERAMIRPLRIKIPPDVGGMKGRPITKQDPFFKEGEFNIE